MLAMGGVSDGVCAQGMGRLARVGVCERLEVSALRGLSATIMMWKFMAGSFRWCREPSLELLSIGKEVSGVPGAEAGAVYRGRGLIQIKAWSEGSCWRQLRRRPLLCAGLSCA